MTDFISSQPSERVVKNTLSGVTAASTLPATYYSDIRDALSDIQRKDCETTPYDMLWALNRTGLLNSFLQEINSPEALLLGLAQLHGYLGIEQPYDDEGTDQRLQAANFLKHVATSHLSPSSKASVIQQEEPFTEPQLAQTIALADMLFCQATLGINNESSTKEVLECAQRFFPSMPENKALFITTLTRRFDVNNFTSSTPSLPDYSDKENNVLLCKNYLKSWITEISTQHNFDNDDKINMASVKFLLQSIEDALERATPNGQKTR